MTSAQFAVADQIRFSVSVWWNAYPDHTTRQIVIKCGKQTIMDELYCKDSRDIATIQIKSYLDDETAAEYIKNLPAT